MSLASRDERGAVAILFAAGAVFLFVLAAMVIDLGLARDVKRNSQNAADASALAAVNVLYPDSGICTLLNPNGGTSAPCIADAAAAAREYAGSNFGTSDDDWAGCSDTGHYWVPASYSQCISFTDDSLTAAPVTLPTKVRVVIPAENVRTGLGALADVSNIEIRTKARATLTSGIGAACTICTLNPNAANSLGNAQIWAMNGGGIHVSGAVGSGPHGELKSCSGTNLATCGPNGGTVAFNASAAAVPAGLDVSTPVTYQQGNVPDPFPTSIYPTLPTTYSIQSGGNLCNGPGIYMNPSTSGAGCTSLPNGIYTIIGGTLNFGALRTTNAGATFYFTCNEHTGNGGNRRYRARTCNNEAGADFDLNGNATTLLRAPVTSVNGSVPGMLIMMDKTNSASVRLNGTVSPTTTFGTIYMPGATLDVRGTADVKLTGQLIVGTLTGNGSGKLWVTASDDVARSNPTGPALDQ